jgi:hypothetical protein
MMCAEVIRYLYRARYPFIMPVVRHERTANDPRGPSGTHVFAAAKCSGIYSPLLLLGEVLNPHPFLPPSKGRVREGGDFRKSSNPGSVIILSSPLDKTVLIISSLSSALGAVSTRLLVWAV